MKTRWIDTGRVNSLHSQCIYHGLGYAQNGRSPNTIVLAQPETPYICVGHFQDPLTELNINYCRENNLPVIRRQTGGGAVYIDDNQLFVQWIFQPKSIPHKVENKFALFMEPMIETYKFFGIDAYAYGRNDVHVNGKKIVGTGAARIGNAEVITGNFIADFNSNHMVGALNLPGKSMRSEVGKGMNEYISSMSAELDVVPNFEEIKAVYKMKCKEIHGMDFFDDDFTKKELWHIAQQDEKLSSDSWTFSIKSPQKDSRVIKIHSGIWIGHTEYKTVNRKVEITIRLKETTIDFIHIEDYKEDYLDQYRKFERALLKTHLNEDHIKEKTESFFMNYSPDEMSLSISEWVEALMMIKNEQKRVSGGT